MSLHINNQNNLNDMFDKFATFNSDDPKRDKFLKKDKKSTNKSKDKPKKD